MFYALVSLRVIPNSQPHYQYLSHFTARARENGQLSIDCFADRSRRIIQDFNDTYETTEKYIERGINHLECATYYYPKSIPRWHGQPHYVEIWIEKDALSGTFKSILENRQVKIVPNRGFSSVSFDHENIERLKSYQNQGRQIHIRYFGDLDPSGESIDEIIASRLSKYGIFGVDFKRIAVTEEQMNSFNLPRNPDSETLRKLKRDTRAKSFMSRHNGDLFQIEVDALQAYAPDEFKRLVQESVDKLFDEVTHQQILAEFSPGEINRLVKKSLRSLLNRL